MTTRTSNVLSPKNLNVKGFKRGYNMDVVAENKILVMHKGSGILLKSFVSSVGGVLAVSSTNSVDIIQQAYICNSAVHHTVEDGTV